MEMEQYDTYHIHKHDLKSLKRIDHCDRNISLHTFGAFKDKIYCYTRCYNMHNRDLSIMDDDKIMDKIIVYDISTLTKLYTFNIESLKHIYDNYVLSITNDVLVLASDKEMSIYDMN
jgi:hypothetical protein